MKITFENCGRGQETWTADLSEVEFRPMLMALRKKPGAPVMSSDIDFLFDTDSTVNGSVLVGGFRPIGRFRIER